jgi:hypothetical protein
VVEHQGAELEQTDASSAVARTSNEVLPFLQGDWALTPARVLAVQRSAGNRAARAAIQRAPRRALQRLGYPLSKPLPKGAEAPAYGEKTGQRRYSVKQFDAMWSAQFHAMSVDEQLNVYQGCIGITKTNLGIIGETKAPPLTEVYGEFEQARAVAAKRNEALGPIDPTKPVSVWVMFGMLFWSNTATKENPKKGLPNEPDRVPDLEARETADPKAYRPDRVTGRVDMSTIDDVWTLGRADSVNFDFGFWDELTGSFWHANHGTYDEMQTDEMIYQSTRDKFAHKLNTSQGERVTYSDFDRVVYGVAITTVMPEKLILPSRDDHIKEFKTDVARGNWADAALVLNGFSDDDIKRLGRTLTRQERSMIKGMAASAMPGWSDRVIDGLNAVDQEPPPRREVMSALDASIKKGDWADVALRLNGLSDGDLKARVLLLTPAQRASVAAAAPDAMPGWSDRVTAAIAAANAPKKRKKAVRR